MGKKLNTGLAHGATASSQLSIENNEYDDKVRKLAEDIELEEGIRELERAHVKFTRDAVRFVTIDRTGQLVWLEDGNESAGLNISCTVTERRIMAMGMILRKRMALGKAM